MTNEQTMDVMGTEESQTKPKHINRAATEPCAYCGEIDRDDPFPRRGEHIIPKNVGGNITGQRNPFVLKNVGMWCNNQMGMRVDARYTRYWLTEQYRAGIKWRHVNLDAKPALPLAYFGETNVVGPDGRHCAIWRGPAQDLILHFRHPPTVPLTNPWMHDDAEVQSSDPGLVLLYVAATNPAWHGTILASVVQQFPRARKYVANPSNIEHIPSPFRPPIPRNYRPLLDELQQRILEPQPLHDEHFSDRFEIKVALALGARFLDPRYITSEDARNLRNLMWSKDDTTLDDSPYRGVSMTADMGALQPLLGWEDGHVIMMKPFQEFLTCNLIMFGRQSAIRIITTQEAFWRSHIDPEGEVYVLFPGLQRCIGPINYMHYLWWKHGKGKGTYADLDALQQAIDGLPPVPSPV